MNIDKSVRDDFVDFDLADLEIWITINIHALSISSFREVLISVSDIKIWTCTCICICGHIKNLAITKKRTSTRVTIDRLIRWAKIHRVLHSQIHWEEEGIVVCFGSLWSIPWDWDKATKDLALPCFNNCNCWTLIINFSMDKFSSPAVSWAPEKQLKRCIFIEILDELVHHFLLGSNCNNFWIIEWFFCPFFLSNLLFFLCSHSPLILIMEPQNSIDLLP